MDGEGNILVVDSNSDHIQKFTAGGFPSVSTGGNGHLQFYIYGLIFNATNDKAYVVDAYLTEYKF